MHGLFNYDGVLVQTCNKIADGICLSLLWLLSSLPVVTIGASTTALYYAVNKCIRRSEGGVWRTYWQAFRRNFKQATLMWLILLILYSILGACCYSAYLMCASGYLPKEMFFFSLLVPALLSIWTCFLFPYLARFQNTSRGIFKNCVFLAIMHFPVGLMHLAGLLLCVVAVAFFPFVILCAPGIYMLLSCYALEKIFRKYMTEEDRAREDIRDKEQ